MNTVLIVGANRGIGLEMARVYRARGDTVLGACRSASPELRALGAEVIEGVDVAKPEGADALAKAVGARTVDTVVVVAGILKRVGLEDFDETAIREQFEVNALGPLRIARAVKDRVAKGGKIAFLTSRMGSIDDNSSGGHYGYRMSKAALNMAGKSLAIDLKDRAAVMLLHPGYVRTDMTGGHGDIDAKDAAADLVKRIDELSPATTGTFRHANGSALPW